MQATRLKDIMTTVYSVTLHASRSVPVLAVHLYLCRQSWCFARPHVAPSSGSPTYWIHQIL